MPSIYWYCSLPIIGIGILIFTMYKKRNFVDLYPFFSFAAIVGAHGEFIILFLFQSYSYKPGVFTDPWAEQMLGHYLPNVGLWAPTAVMVAAFSLRSIWILLISIAYMTIETIFLKLGLYEQHWWRTYLTGIAVIVFHILSKIWYKELFIRQNRFIRYITLYGTAWGIIHSPIILLILLGKMHYSIGWFANVYRDSTMFNIVYTHYIAATFIFFVCILNKWFWKLIPIILFSLSDIILLKLNILVFKDGWNIFYLILVRTSILVVFILLEKYSLRNSIRKHEYL